MSTIIVLEGGEMLRLQKNGEKQSSKSVMSPTTQKIVTASPESSKHLIHATGGTKPRSPLSSPSNDNGFVIMKRITSPEQTSLPSTVVSITGIGAAVPQPAPSINQPPTLSYSSPSSPSSSPRPRILPYKDAKSNHPLPHSALSPVLGVDHAKMPLYAPHQTPLSPRLSDPVLDNVKHVDSGAGVITQFVQFRPMLIRSPQLTTSNDEEGPRLAPLHSPLSNSPPARQSRLPHSALSPTSLGVTSSAPSLNDRRTLSGMEDHREKQNQLIRRINERERELIVAVNVSLKQPVPKFYGSMPSSTGIDSLDNQTAEVKTTRPTQSVVMNGIVDVQRDDQVLTLLQQLKIDLHSELAGILK
jgi:hypothetical protein